MLTEVRQDFLVELGCSDGGLSILPCPPSIPKAHRFQGGLIYSRMIDIEGQLETWHFSQHSPPYIGTICDRTDELPGGGLEVSLYVPKDAWLTAVGCLSTVWRRLELTGADGDGDSMRLVNFAFLSGGPSPV